MKNAVSSIIIFYVIENLLYKWNRIIKIADDVKMC